MKKTFLFWTLGLVLTLPSCLRDECLSHRVFVRMDPVYTTVQALREGGFSTGPARALRNPGKIADQRIRECWAGEGPGS